MAKYSFLPLSATKHFKNTFLHVFPLFLVLGFLAFIVWTIARDWHILIAYAWQFKWLYILGLACLHFWACFSLFCAWHSLLKIFGILIPWPGNLQIYFFSLVARRIPTPIWYIGSRVHLYKKESISPAVILTASSLEMLLISLVGLIFYFMLMPWYTFPLKNAGLMAAITCGLLGIVIVYPNLVIIITNRVLTWLHRPPLEVSLSRRELLPALLFYGVTWALDGMGLYCLLQATLDISPSIIDSLGVSTLSVLVSIINLFVPGLAGVKEITIGVLLSVWLPVSVGFILAVLYRILQTLLEIVFAIMIAGIRRIPSFKWFGRKSNLPF